ncbi:MAG: cytochrome c maturation protein CcmE [Alphaproteobacteria bacterium]
MTRKRARLYMVLMLLGGVLVATVLVFVALGQNVSYFRTPTEIMSGTYPEKQSGRALRLGGLVETGSLTHTGSEIDFRITDMKNTLSVHYAGIVPDLFREGQGVIATGKMDESGVFQATVLLAKHDEKYMPPEVAKELKDAGHPQ